MIDQVSLAQLTPIMQQYWSIKKQHTSEWVLFQLGDFYELFYEDAQEASRVLDLTLTHRNGIPMSGIPVHTLETYIKKMLSINRSVVLCQQVGNPEGKGPMAREVTRIFTPGTVYEAEFLDVKKTNYLACYHSIKQDHALVWIDFCEGIVWWTGSKKQNLKGYLKDLDAKEILVVKGQLLDSDDSSIHAIDPWYFSPKENESYIQKAFPRWGDYCDQEMTECVWAAIGAIVRYGSERIGNPAVFRGICQHSDSAVLEIDTLSREHLNIEIGQESNNKSLWFLLNQTQTPMGSRLLQKWIREPTRDLKGLTRRYNAIEYWNYDCEHTASIHHLLKKIMDLERMATKMTLGKVKPRDLLVLADSLEAIIEMRHYLEKSDLMALPCFETWSESYGIEFIRKWIVSDSSMYGIDTVVLHETVSIEYKQLLDQIASHHAEMCRYIEKQQENLGLAIKMGYNSVQGHYLEVSKSQSHRVPDSFTRVQTLKNCERYQSAEWILLSNTLSTLEQSLERVQESLWLTVLKEVQAWSKFLIALSKTIADYDVTLCFSKIALEQNYTRPQHKAERGISIEQGRHPLVEKHSQKAFIANDCILEEWTGRFMLLTGPNMGGKSTYMRQIALIIFMAHIGSFVPAKSMTTGPIDRILTRIGANDKISEHQSTFMVELTETARILRQATEYSLVLIDEMGRGTSTYDGLSIAWSTAEELYFYNQSFCLFSTHYKELGQMLATCPNMQAYCFTGIIEKENIVFPYRIEAGVGSHSFGLYVAKKAGLPERVLQKAWSIHEGLLEKGLVGLCEPKTTSVETADITDQQMDLWAVPQQWDLETMSPKEAWMALEQWQGLIRASENCSKRGAHQDKNERALLRIEANLE